MANYWTVTTANGKISLTVPSRARRMKRERFFFIQIIAVLLLLFTASIQITNASEAETNDSGEIPSDVVGGNGENTNKLRLEQKLAETIANAAAQTYVHDDTVEDSIYDPVQPDLDSCSISSTASTGDGQSIKNDPSCFRPPDSTIEISLERRKQPKKVCVGGSSAGEDNGNENNNGEPVKETCRIEEEEVEVEVDKHWGSDPTILRMRDALRFKGKPSSDEAIEHPPIFLMPGLASTRLVAWRHKTCDHPLVPDIKVLDLLWMNIKLLMQVASIDDKCFTQCMKLGKNQTDTDDYDRGCKLRPDEGLDAISSLSPGGVGSTLLVGGTNTVYAWLIQWLADNLGYDVSNIIGLPYDWRLSPDKMEDRDGFFTTTRRRMEAAVASNGGKPGILVAHSMGNLIFRYFLEWLKVELRKEYYEKFVREAEKQAERRSRVVNTIGSSTTSMIPGLSSWRSWLTTSDDEIQQTQDGSSTQNSKTSINKEQLLELAEIEGEAAWYEWIEAHIWTYVGLSAPLLGAVNPLRAVISGENMGLPVADETARIMEQSWGSTHTVNTISTKLGFCDNWDTQAAWDAEPTTTQSSQSEEHHKLACLDDILTEIENSGEITGRDPWENFAALKALMRERQDWDSDFYMMRFVQEMCGPKEKSPCANTTTTHIKPSDVVSGNIFTVVNEIWKEKDSPLITKLEQLKESFWDTDVPNILERIWERPLVKHVVMAYGVDIPTEVGYIYKKKINKKKNKYKYKNNKDDEDQYDDMPSVQSAFWEVSGGKLTEEKIEKISRSPLDVLSKKKNKHTEIGQGSLQHSGDGSVPYLSLSWAHTWLLHAVRALRHSGKGEEGENPLDSIRISHRPKGATEWKDEPPPAAVTLKGEKKVEESTDTGTAHPHGTKYKPEMVRYHSTGTSRTTGIEYTTTVIEALGVEHKETTRNYDILAAVFTDVLRKMHDDLRPAQ